MNVLPGMSLPLGAAAAGFPPYAGTNIATTGTASASSSFGGGAGGSYDPAGLIDGLFATTGNDEWASNTGLPQWAAIDLGSVQHIYRYAVRTGFGWGSFTSTWEFQGSDDGSSWTTIETRSSVSLSGDWVRTEYTLTAPVQYRHYRINVTSSTINRGAFGEIELLQ